MAIVFLTAFLTSFLETKTDHEVIENTKQTNHNDDIIQQAANE